MVLDATDFQAITDSSVKLFDERVEEIAKLAELYDRFADARNPTGATLAPWLPVGLRRRLKGAGFRFRGS